MSATFHPSTQLILFCPLRTLSHLAQYATFPPILTLPSLHQSPLPSAVLPLAPLPTCVHRGRDEGMQTAGQRRNTQAGFTPTLATRRDLPNCVISLGSETDVRRAAEEELQVSEGPKW
jgi:hypothetical protein